MQLKDKVAVITGGASGQGEAAAWTFQRAGARVILLDWNAELGRSVAGALEREGGNPLFLQVDIGDAAQVEAACARILGDVGTIDVLFNNAGIGYSQTGRYPMAGIFDTPLEAWNDILRINLTGAFLMTRFLGPAMVEAGRGSIVFNTSISALVGQADIDAYTASKGALVALTRSLAASLGPKGIRVNAIAPGTIDTPMVAPVLEGMRENRLAAIPLRRIGTPQDIADLALFLASDQSGYITGQIIACDGGRVAI